MKKVKYFLVILLFIFGISGCQTNTIAMGGSSSVHPLMDVVKDDYSAEFPDKHISYDGPGSSKGVEGIKNGIYQFGFLSREVKDSEKTPDMSIQTICYDGIAVVINNQNPINSLTTQQIKQIYQGEITNWNQVGGNDAPISVVARDNASGTRSSFDEIIGIEHVTDSAILYDSNGAITQNVQNNADSIGYISFDTLNRNQGLIKQVSVDGISPTAEAVINKEYKLYRPFVMVYYQDKLTSDGQEFLSWFEANLNRLVIEAGFIVNGG